MSWVTIGRGVTVGTGSVMTKDVPDFCIFAGNPVKFIRKIEPKAPDPRLGKGADESGVEATLSS
jgi:acetyltransferase-like isoleucine patch superfamily enzyme